MVGRRKRGPPPCHPDTCPGAVPAAGYGVMPGPARSRASWRRGRPRSGSAGRVSRVDGAPVRAVWFNAAVTDFTKAFSKVLRMSQPAWALACSWATSVARYDWLWLPDPISFFCSLAVFA